MYLSQYEKHLKQNKPSPPNVAIMLTSSGWWHPITFPSSCCSSTLWSHLNMRTIFSWCIRQQTQPDFPTTYLLKTFFSSLERDVLALCFRSLRLGYFFFFPFPFWPTRSEPRFSPVAASMSLISSVSRQSTTQQRGLNVLYSFIFHFCYTPKMFYTRYEYKSNKSHFHRWSINWFVQVFVNKAPPTGGDLLWHGYCKMCNPLPSSPANGAGFSLHVSKSDCMTKKNLTHRRPGSVVQVKL